MLLLTFFHFLLRFFVKLAKKFFYDYNRTEIFSLNKNFIIINKGYDIKINSNNKNEYTVQTFIKKKLPYLVVSSLYHEFYFVHRLDYSTSGLMCIPVHKKACQVVAKAIQERQCKKYYIALVRGYLSEKILDLDLPIGRDYTVKTIEKMCVIKEANSKNSRSLILVLEEGLFDGYPSSKVLIRPITGRRHQIRVHCSHIGHTIVGDYTYSNKKDLKPKRMFLHSTRLFIPNKLEEINVESGDPFTERQISSWISFFKYYTINEAYLKLDLVINKC